MSRSYRKPYAAITGTRSAADDKRVARLNWRHAQNNALRAPGIDWDDFMIPARLEASFNDVWGWGRDGRQYLHFEPRWSEYKHWFSKWLEDDKAEKARLKSYEAAVLRFKRLHRK